MAEKEYTICCPQCQHDQDVTLSDKLDPNARPDLKERLLENTFNRIECEACGFSFRADMPLLYTDMEKGIIIHWIPLHNQSLAQLQQEFKESQEEMRRELPEGTPVPRLQLVLTRVELVERIFMLEQKLDERLIEYAKFMIYQNNVARISAKDKALLFNAQKSDDTNFCFAVQDIATATFDEVLGYPRSQYQKLRNKFMADDEELTALFPGAYKNARLAFLERNGE
jgi:hypothetical protein